MFSDYEAKSVSFYKKKKNVQEENILIQTDDFEIEYEDKLIQTQIRKDKLIQTDISEIASMASSINVDIDKIKKFIDKVFYD
jgi:hypothetical protein